MKLKMSKEVDLGKEPIGHLLFVLAVPSIISQVVNALYNMVDRMYIGHIPGEGAAALTGLGVCFPVIMIVSAFAALMGNGRRTKSQYSDREKRIMRVQRRYWETVFLHW